MIRSNLNGGGGCKGLNLALGIVRRRINRGSWLRLDALLLGLRVEVLLHHSKSLSIGAGVRCYASVLVSESMDLEHGLSELDLSGSG